VTDDAAPGQARVLLRAEGLHKRFGGVHAVRGISLAVPAASVFAIIGPNGAGKSTMLNLLSGVHLADEGRLEFDGTDLAGLAAYRRARLGMARTFQKIRLFKQLSVLDNVLAGFHTRHRIPAVQFILHGPAFRADIRRCRGEALDLLDFVGLLPRADVLAGVLSYGEQRLLEIARALATEPKLLMIDEPAAGLNGAEVELLMHRIDELRGRGLAVILIEHNMDMVTRIADQVMVMHYGQHLFTGPPAAMQSNPAVIEAYLGGELT
jgi:ABC-type branched-subunit amino acid transport system ATPase component